MSIPVRLAAIDDFLLDRVYQPVVDFAAQFDIKTRHLSAASYLMAGAVAYMSGHHLLLFPCAVLASVTLFSRMPNSFFRESAVNGRIFNLVLTVFLSLVPPSLAMSAVCCALDAALYFRACHDKPPKRRWWKELKRALEALAWMPELEPARAKS